VVAIASLQWQSLIKSGGMEGVTKPVVDGECDPAVLTDVLAFLDGFHESASSECEAGAAATTGTLAPPSSSLSSDSTPATCSALLLGTRWRQTNALEENRPRVARYWRHKDELQSLRTVAEYLSNVLEFMKSGAHRPLRLEPTSDSGIVDWKQCAEQEMLLLERARRTNTDLRRLVRSEKHFASTIGSLLNSAWPHAWEIQVLSLILAGRHISKRVPTDLALDPMCIRAANHRELGAIGLPEQRCYELIQRMDDIILHPVGRSESPWHSVVARSAERLAPIQSWTRLVLGAYP